MSVDVLQRIETKVADIYNVISQGGGGSPVLQRLDRVESALFSGSGAGLIISSASIAEVISSTNFVTGVSGWRIQKSGDVEFQNGTFRGDITADSGFFSGTVWVGETNNRILIDGPNKLLRSENYVAGVSGWQIDGDGDAEFQNVLIRGTLQSTVFSYNEVTAVGGQAYVVQRAGTLRSDVITVTSPTTFNVDIKDPDSGHVQLFSTSDILRITDAGNTNWITVSSVSDQTTFYRYVCTKNNGTNSTFRAGTAVLSYGTSGDGYVLMDAQSATGPHISVATHAGSPWSVTTERVRIGNLNGWGDFVSDVFGFALGDYAASSYIYFDPATSNTKLVNGNGSVVIDKDGIVLQHGDLDVNKITWKNGSTAIATIGVDNTGGVDALAALVVLDQGNTVGHTIQLYTKNRAVAAYGAMLTVFSGETTAPASEPYFQFALRDSANIPTTVLLNEDHLQYLYNSLELLDIKEDSNYLRAYHSGTKQTEVAATTSGVNGGDVVISTLYSGAEQAKITVHADDNFTSNDVTIAVKNATTLNNIARFSTIGITLSTGAGVNEFSTDGTMAGNSDAAVPTEKAVVTYAKKISAFAAHKNSTNQTGVVTATFTKLTATTELFDAEDDYDAANSKHTPLTAGYYFYTATVRYEASTDQAILLVTIYKNGAEVKRGGVNASGTSSHQVMVSTMISMNGSTDNVEFYLWHNTGSNRTIEGDTISTHVQGHLVTRS